MDSLSNMNVLKETLPTEETVPEPVQPINQTINQEIENIHPNEEEYYQLVPHEQPTPREEMPEIIIPYFRDLPSEILSEIIKDGQMFAPYIFVENYNSLSDEFRNRFFYEPVEMVIDEVSELIAYRIIRRDTEDYQHPIPI